MRPVDLEPGVALARGVDKCLMRIMPEVLFERAFVYMIHRCKVILLPGRYYKVHRLIYYHSTCLLDMPPCYVGFS
jgi:hypothetical protein